MGARQVEDGELVPLISAGLVVVAAIVGGMDYNLIQRGSQLLFYAVLVQMWTTLESGSRIGNPAYWEFLLNSAGAVAVGFTVEMLVAYLSGEVIAAQFLSLAILSSRVYVNRMRSSDIIEAFRWHDPIDRYVFLIPCSVAILLPILLYQIQINPILGYDPNSITNQNQDAFTALIILSILTGVAIYGRLEEGWSLKS
jgi:hypothetical protein